jgi:aryl-alcohol dehydrogenase-like predicted oxidoreductase
LDNADPGALRVNHLEESVGAAGLSLKSAEIAELDSTA